MLFNGTLSPLEKIGKKISLTIFMFSAQKIKNKINDSGTHMHADA